MDLIVGNAQDADTRGTGWFIGFSEWTRHGDPPLLHVPSGQALNGLCVKWFDHPSGHDSGDKPLSDGRTVSILVTEGSRFRIDFCETAGFDPQATRTVWLSRHGDYAAWGAGLHHRWHCETRSTVLTLRWNPS